MPQSLAFTTATAAAHMGGSENKFFSVEVTIVTPQTLLCESGVFLQGVTTIAMLTVLFCSTDTPKKTHSLDSHILVTSPLSGDEFVLFCGLVAVAKDGKELTVV